jgi:EmrB/QacA subfamily drug resistance transporter
MGVVLFGTFMVVLDTTVVNLALPALQAEFGSIEGVEWVVTAYLATVGVAQMLSGWAGDRFGRRNVFITALTTFTVGSFLCALSPTLGVLIGARVVQGVGGGMLMPVGMAMIYELFDPEERGKALGYFGIAVMAAPAIGPVLGGGLVESVGWRWIFLINVPIGMVGIPVAARLLHQSGFRERRPLDVTGLLLSSGGILLLLVALSTGGMHGWADPTTVAMLAGAVVLLVAFGVHALRSDHPLVDVRILGIPVFAVGMACLGLLAVAQYTRLVYIPLELGAARGISELDIGLLMLPSALGMAVTMPVGGRMADRIGARVPVSVGIALLAVSFWPLGNLHPDSSLVWISVWLFVGGLGSGLAMMAPNIVALNAVPGRLVSQASALSSTVRQMSAAVGTSLMAALFATIRPPSAGAGPAEQIEAYNTLFLVAGALLVVLLVVAQFLPGRARALELQAARRAEHLDSRVTDEADATELATAGMEL